MRPSAPSVDSAETVIALLSSGLGAGVLTGTQLGGFPLLASLPDRQYLTTHAFFATRYDPFMPACLITTTLVTAHRATSNTGMSRTYLLGAATSALLTAVISVSINVPINRWVQAVDLTGPLPDVTKVRSRWGRANAARSVLGTVAFFLTCLSSISSQNIKGAKPTERIMTTQHRGTR